MRTSMPEALSLVEDLPYIDPWTKAPDDNPTDTTPPKSRAQQQRDAVVAHQGGIVVPG